MPRSRVGAWSYPDHDSPSTRHEGDLYVEYLGRTSYLTFYDNDLGTFHENQGPYVAKKGEVWVMDDNRNNSLDSRDGSEGREAACLWRTFAGARSSCG